MRAFNIRVHCDYIMRLCFGVKTKICSEPQGFMPVTVNFPADTLGYAIVSNHSEATYQKVTCVNDGSFNVDFVLKSDVPLNDQLKFHLYSKEGNVVVIAAGAIPMSTISKVMAGNQVEPVKITNNFTSIYAMLTLVPPTSPMVLDTSELKPSVLSNTDVIKELMNLSTREVGNMILSKTVVESAKAQFCSLGTAHNFMDQVTTHVHFQKEMEPTKKQCERFNLSGLTMTALLEGLHLQCKTADQVLQMDASSPEFTKFVALVVQSYMRSAHVCPYVFDMILQNSLDSAGKLKTVYGEKFLIPLAEPLNLQTGSLFGDDCEGQATFILHLFRSFQHLSQQTYSDALFPTHLFDLNSEEKKQLWNVACKIGSAKMNCGITLMSANCAALGQETGGAVMGHATSILTNSTNPQSKIDWLLEGTNALSLDHDIRKMTIANKEMYVSDVANFMTQQISALFGENIEGSSDDIRRLIHMNPNTEGKFYREAFVSNGMVMGTQIGDVTSYGLDLKNISNYDVKVVLPVNGILNTATQRDKVETVLDKLIEQRSTEIHPPFVSLQSLLNFTRHWSALKMPGEVPMGKEFTICSAMYSIRDLQQRNLLQSKLSDAVCKWNAKYNNIGHLATYCAIDTCFLRLCLYTGDLATLEKNMAEHIKNASSPCSGTS